MTMSPVRRILIPVDFSDSSRGALRFGRALAQALGASVEVLHVLEPSRGMLSGASSEALAGDPAEARGLLRDFVRAAGGPEQVSTTERVESGGAHDRIVSIADQEGFDLIVMGTSGRTGRAHVLVGSVAETVVRMSTRPVLTVRETANAE
jgi:universal stress protein A